MVEWIFVNSYQIPDLLHYLDDFITAGLPQSLQCAQNLSTAMEVCQWLGRPLHPGKCVGPFTVLIVLGQLRQPSGTFSVREALSIAKFDWYLAPSEMVQQTQA